MPPWFRTCAAAAALYAVFDAPQTLRAPGARAADELIIHQRDRTFVPGALSVARNAAVHFVNDENIVHHAYVESAHFKAESGDIPPGGVATLVFDTEGRFLVRCAIHPRMKLDVTVAP